MTSQTCIISNVSTGSHDPATGLLSHVSNATIETQISLTKPAAGLKKAVTFLMARAAPSNYGVKPTAGRSPRPGLKPLP